MMRNFGKCIPNKEVMVERPYNVLPVYSINYDFVPGQRSRATSLWVDIKYDPKDFNLNVNGLVFLRSLNKDLVLPSQVFKIIDIVATKVVLYPIAPPSSTQPIYPFQAKNDFPKATWHPLDHGGHWGYSTRNHESFPSANQNWIFGHGSPVAEILW